MIDLVGPHRAATVLKVHRTTVHRLITQELEPSTAVILVLRGLAYGEMPGSERMWEGWKFVDGDLYSPAGDKFHQGNLLGQKYERQLVKELQRQIKALEDRITALTKEVARSDVAANDLAISENDARSKAYGS